MPNKETLDEASEINLDELDKVKLPTQVKGKVEYHSTPTQSETLDKILIEFGGTLFVEGQRGTTGFIVENNAIDARMAIEALIATSNKEAVEAELMALRLLAVKPRTDFARDIAYVSLKDIDAHLATYLKEEQPK